jgi:hypothetical protein
LKKILILIALVIFGGVISSNSVFATNLTPSEEFTEFQKWADDHSIILQGTNKSTNELYYGGWIQSRDGLDWKSIPNVMNVYTSLSKLPDDILQVANGQTIYLSNQNGRSYTVLGSWPEHHILENMNKGIILEQPISTQTIVHEFGHVVDFNAIQCTYQCSLFNYNSMNTQRLEIFETSQAGYISDYAKTNTNENFAENFAYYVNQPEKYQTKLLKDDTLKEEYNFIKNIIFLGRTFS